MKEPIGCDSNCRARPNAHFSTIGSNKQGIRWVTLSYGCNEKNAANAMNTAHIHRVTAPRPVLDAMKKRMQPGMVPVLTDLPTHPDSRSGEDFVIMN